MVYPLNYSRGATAEDISQPGRSQLWSLMYPEKSIVQKQRQSNSKIAGLRGAFGGNVDGLLRDLEKKYGYSELDSFLVLKDILGSVWKSRKKG